MPAAMSKLSANEHGSPLKLHRRATFDEVSTGSHQPLSPAFPRFSPTGTALAIDNRAIGVAAHSPCSTGRGGARNSATRESKALSTAHLGNLIAAARHAEAIGLPLNRMITIHWEAAGVPLSDMAKATGRFTDLLAKALRRRGSRTSFLWVHENGDGKGGHCHLLAHVPAALVRHVAGLQKAWLRRITGRPYRARVVHSRPIGGRLGLERDNPELHAINLEAALAYLLKGAGEDAGEQFALHRLEPGGRVIGKRCGTSQNIGRKARNSEGQA